MAAEAQTSCISRSSASVVLNIQHKQVLVIHKGRISCTCTISLMRNDRKCKHIFVFPRINSAPHALRIWQFHSWFWYFSRELKLEDTYFNRDVEKAFVAASSSVYKSKTVPTLTLSNRVGNMYTPSVYGGLASLLSNRSAPELAGQRIVLFSYGSGLASSMFSLRVTSDLGEGSRLIRLVSSLVDLSARLDSRRKVDPADFAKIMKLRQDTHHLGTWC